MSRHAYWITTCLFLALVASKFSTQTGFTSLIRFGATWEARRLAQLKELPIATVPQSNGYDGQFYAQLALDPLLRDTATGEALDVPAYRARRILVPAVAHTLGLGNPWWILQIYALLNVACWLVLAWLLRQAILGSDWMSFARWFGCVFGMGVLESVRQSLVDLPAMALLVFAIVAHERTSFAKSRVYLALANLAKESNVLASLALYIETRHWPFITKRGAISLALAILPIVAWSFYVNHQLPGSNGSSGVGNFTWPLLGMALHLMTCVTEIAQGSWDGRFTMGLLAAVGLTTQAWTLWRTPCLKSGWWRVGAAYALLLLVLSPWVWSGYWAACRALLPLTIAFNLLLPNASRAFWPLWIVGNSTLLHAIWRFL